MQQDATQAQPATADVTGAAAPNSDAAALQQMGFSHLLQNFDPLGLTGLLYWYALYPLHRLIFAGMLRRIAEAAERSGVAPAATSSRGRRANGDEGRAPDDDGRDRTTTPRAGRGRGANRGARR